MKTTIAILLLVLCCTAQVPPASVGQPLPPPPLPYPGYYYVYTNYPTHQQQYAVRADFAPNGEWKVVCKAYDCGATNNVLPKGTNIVVIEQLGGRTVEQWLKLKCPVCDTGFSNRFTQVWVPEIPPIPVLVITNFDGISTNKTLRK